MRNGLCFRSSFSSSRFGLLDNFSSSLDATNFGGGEGEESGDAVVALRCLLEVFPVGDSVTPRFLGATGLPAVVALDFLALAKSSAPLLSSDFVLLLTAEALELFLTGTGDELLREVLELSEDEVDFLLLPDLILGSLCLAAEVAPLLLSGECLPTMLLDFELSCK